jgi:hypothetical protein
MCSSLDDVSTFHKIMGWQDAVTDEDHERHLFAAAIRTNTLSVVKDCINNNAALLDALPYPFIGPRPRRKTTSVRARAAQRRILPMGSFKELVVSYANEKVLAYLFTAGVDKLNEQLPDEVFWGTYCAHRAEILRFTYNFMREEFPLEFERIDCVGTSPWYWHMSSDLEVLKVVESLIPIPASSTNGTGKSTILSRAADEGRLHAVKYKIERGAAATGPPLERIVTHGLVSHRRTVPYEPRQRTATRRSLSSYSITVVCKMEAFWSCRADGVNWATGERFEGTGGADGGAAFKVGDVEEVTGGADGVTWGAGEGFEEGDGG